MDRRSSPPCPLPLLSPGSASPAGEFYAEGPKHKKSKQSKESQIYGIWCTPHIPCSCPHSLPPPLPGTGPMNPMTTGEIVFLMQLQQPALISAYRYIGRGSKGRKGKGAGGVVEGSAPTFVTEEGGNSDGSDGGAGGEEQENIRGGLGSSARSGIGGGKKQQQQQARAHQPIASNAAFAASLFQVRSCSC